MTDTLLRPSRLVRLACIYLYSADADTDADASLMQCVAYSGYAPCCREEITSLVFVVLGDWVFTGGLVAIGADSCSYSSCECGGCGG